MKKVFVTFDYEFLDLKGFAIMPESDWEGLKGDIAGYDYSDRGYERYYGNHFMRFQSEENLLDSFTVKKVTDNEIDTLVHLFGDEDWGIDPRIFMEDY